ncbi:hypothetical protein EV207_10539 [Scopulibacillus darangshiensis]|uniref:Uncharacterized protein n=1 Tax=Scopulibacillus darangshiensis TaxID=442528 RepID=A0A4R2P6I8_9BACL|nr:hypothetical protein EV207_10539 [Scopulibacillus darangshiensis]
MKHKLPSMRGIYALAKLRILIYLTHKVVALTCV